MRDATNGENGENDIESSESDGEGGEVNWQLHNQVNKVSTSMPAQQLFTRNEIILFYDEFYFNYFCWGTLYIVNVAISSSRFLSTTVLSYFHGTQGPKSCLISLSHIVECLSNVLQLQVGLTFHPLTFKK